MRIMMVGAGAVGGFFAAQLVAQGVECSLLLRPKTLEAVRLHGLIVRGTQHACTVHPPAASDPRELPAPDLIILGVKRYDLDEALEQLRPVLTAERTILTLQNGIDTEARIAELFPDVRMLAGVAYIYAKIVAPGIIEHYKKGALAIGDWSAAPSRTGGPAAPAVKAVFDQAGVKCQIVEDIRRTKWEKMCWNVAFNPLTVLIDDRVAKALAHPELRAVIARLVEETVAVAHAEGVALAPRMAENVIQWSQEIRDIHTSMYDDWKAGRRTEIESLNGYIIRQGAARGIPTPVNETLYALVKTLTEPMPVGPVVLRIEGQVLQPLVLDLEALAHLPAEAQVPDVGAYVPDMRGQGVRVKALLEMATPVIGADHVTFHAADGRFAVSLTVAQAAETGILLYQRDGRPLSPEAGGPFRLVTPGLGDRCANVKGVSRLEFTGGPGKDTRP